MQMNDYFVLWNHASVQVLDIRHAILRVGEELDSYRFPTSGFLYATRGIAQILLDGEVHRSERFHVLHSGKGACIEITEIEDEFEYYLILYKAILPRPCSQAILEMLENSNPFQIQYSFSPNDPISLFHKVKDMNQEWKQPRSIERFYVKSEFYQFVYSILRQFQGQEIYVKEPGIVTQVILYMQKHYSESITLESLAETLNYSVPHLSALFKKETGHSLIHYLIRIRMEMAASLLVETDATLREIAVSVGYEDPYYFGRLFKKYKGVSPARYRVRELEQHKTEESPSNLIRSSIEVQKGPRYIEGDIYDQYKREGLTPMYKQSRSATTATLFLCFALLLSACSVGTSNTNTATSGNQSSSAEVSVSHSSTQAHSVQGSESAPSKTVSTAAGDIRIPVNPQRIIADQYLGSFIALGITPIGTPGLHRQNPYFAEALKDVEDIGDVEGSLEKVIDLQQDLIVTGSAETHSRYQQLSKIAPTISIPYGELKNAHEELTYFGKLLGKEKDAEKWLAEYDRRISVAREKARKAVPSDATFSIFELTPKATYAYGDNFGRGGQAVYQALGFKPPAPTAAEIIKKQWVELSNELLQQYAGDYIILTSNDRTLEDLKADPIWASLDAVKNNRVYIWKEERSWYFDPIAVLSQTEEIADWLAGQR
ncbi:AraC family transcriptional regulator [Brevibacillus laterosporus]|uniref:AraC family transcriptional regulator n=1 Tax=Brevibacillus laterosporus TaxID=1465 RepID=UPI0026534260|nr:AraC family transcriptional regulator [Brevibacillus laterosporus]MDN9012702.1 AraC family transcriptional regulator [Brevibacillus laterosporus]MDO0943791.1 AraC family transcriptional regulator [Brevibacillus laterosporus]